MLVLALDEKLYKVLDYKSVEWGCRLRVVTCINLIYGFLEWAAVTWLNYWSVSKCGIVSRLLCSCKLADERRRRLIQQQIWRLMDMLFGCRQISEVKSQYLQYGIPGSPSAVSTENVTSKRCALSAT